MSPGGLRSGQVVVVDDDAVVRELIATQVRTIGHTCRTAATGEDALRLCDAEPGPAVVVSDVRMPGVDGMELLHRVKRLDESIQVVMVSGLDDLETVQGCLREGACDYLIKPFELEQLTQILERAIERSRRLRQAGEARPDPEGGAGGPAVTARPGGDAGGSQPAGGAAPKVALAELVAYLDGYLEARQGSDYGPNGLQVEGRERVGKLITGVSACRELFTRARSASADAILVHHGLFWRGLSPRLTGFQYERVAELVRGGIALLAYHLPLDRHPEVGNNAVAARRLGLEGLEPFGIHEGLPIGFRGRFGRPLPVARLVDRCREIFGQEPLGFLHGPEEVTTVGIVSGAGAGDLNTAVREGLDAFITGEASEWVMNVAREAGVHFLAAGHYATERLGVQALGEHVRERFGIDVEFIDVPNPV